MVQQVYYRLTCAEDLAPFTPEIDHICAILRESHNFIRSDEAPVWLHYGSDPPAGAVALPAILFPHCVTISPHGIHLDRQALNANWPRLAPKPDATAFDAIGLAFLLLSRIEERDPGNTDRYGRYRFEDDLQVRYGLYGRAAADEALAALARLITGESNPASATEYRVVLTHDVDRIRKYHRPFDPLLLAAGDVLKRHNPLRAVGRLEAYLGNEPWTSVNRLMALSEQYGLRSHFYFMGPSDRSFDSPYALTMAPLLRRLADHIGARGHLLGYHPCSGTAEDLRSWLTQRERLEATLGCTLREGRQHGLLYRADITPDIWDETGMMADFTLAYPEVNGFRSGSTRLLPCYSLRQRRTLNLRHASTAIMEFGMFGGKYRDMSAEAAFDACRPVIDTCRRHGGTLVILQHTGPQLPAARKFYETVLAAAA